MATLYEEWRNVKRELGRMVNRMESGVRAAESVEDVRQREYARGRRDGEAAVKHDYCNGSDLPLRRAEPDGHADALRV